MPSIYIWYYKHLSHLSACMEKYVSTGKAPLFWATEEEIAAYQIVHRT